jgi:cysteinyl-tRNA synthetase
VRYWLHAEHLNIDSQKMSKSAGNIYTLRELLAEGFQPEAIRFFLASVPYRKKLNFTFDALKAAATAVERLRNFKLRLDSGQFPEGASEQLSRRAATAREQFDAALDDDLNTAEALAAIFEFVRDVNTAIDSGELRSQDARAALALIGEFDAIFDVLRPSATHTDIADDEIERLIAERTAAKRSRNFARSDEIRAELLERGVVLEDTRAGTRWKRKAQ